MRSCSYCTNVEHDRRKCPHYQNDMVLLYDITSLYVNVVLDSLVHHGLGPTTLVSVSDPGFHFYKNNPEVGKFVWSKVESESPELFAIDKLELVELCPFALPAGMTYSPQGKYHISLVHLESASLTTLRDSTKPPQYTKVSRNMRSWLWTIPSTNLGDSLRSLETILWRESYGTTRENFVDLLVSVRTELEKFRYEGKHLGLMTDTVVLSGIPSQTLEKYYEAKKQKIIKSSLDKTLETWYKHYSKKIKHNHF